MSAEFRNATRREIRHRIDITDSMTGQIAGQLTDLSSSGLMLSSPTALNLEALYQWRFTLPDASADDASLECGVQIIWLNSSAPGQYTAGARFILIEPTERERIRTWSTAANR
ncbi:MAG: PilZ domain-containing protein [Pseudomonadota bacterium]|nr:PilZ domain-containing protein [Pseudomonadota bacterium]